MRNEASATNTRGARHKLAGNETRRPTTSPPGSSHRRRIRGCWPRERICRRLGTKKPDDVRDFRRQSARAARRAIEVVDVEDDHADVFAGCIPCPPVTAPCHRLLSGSTRRQGPVQRGRRHPASRAPATPSSRRCNRVVRSPTVHGLLAEAMPIAWDCSAVSQSPDVVATAIRQHRQANRTATSLSSSSRTLPSLRMSCRP